LLIVYSRLKRILLMHPKIITTANPVKGIRSGQRTFKELPLRKIPLIIVKKYFAGTAPVIIRINFGMLEIGKMKPDRRKAGSMVKMMDSIKANCWERVTVDIKSPVPNPQIRKIPVTRKRSGRFPFKGTLKIRTPGRTMRAV